MDAAERRRELVGAIVAARKDDESVVFEAANARVTYEDRTLCLSVTDEERDRLETLLDDYHVFKVEGPATRKAEPGVVYLSAVTDAKHAADFVDSLFSEVYDAGEGYDLRVR
ncbi:hypothetical protein [Natronomonas amylolytica]|uniref:hypothetical protein n=1 Tax=Natronomonas amylolytica TaxID=3108498 RepID=UPI00300B92DF